MSKVASFPSRRSAAFYPDKRAFVTIRPKTSGVKLRDQDSCDFLCPPLLIQAGVTDDRGLFMGRLDGPTIQAGRN